MSPPPDPADPAAVAAALIACRSVTPDDDGAQAVVAAVLRRLGFSVHSLAFGATPNLFARLGTAAPHLCFAGHTDVVPPGGPGWTADPFTPALRDGVLYGRGACDMKGGIACFIAACARLLDAGELPGSISLAITGDEEGDARDGTRRLVAWMQHSSQLPDFCLVGEPSNPAALGQMIKIGRRGSLHAVLEVRGVQGHSAYPQRADNPVHRLLRVLTALTGHTLDTGSPAFEPSSLQVTSVDVGNPATNVIPGAATARFNIRFNDLHTGTSLTAWLHTLIGGLAAQYTLEVHVSGEAFMTAPGAAVALLSAAAEAETGRRPVLDTGGGTSDARFFAPHCPVAEFGLVGASMHKVDECVRLADLETLTRIYARFIGAFAAGAESARRDYRP